MDEAPRRDIVVIGGSAGATAPLKALLGGLPPDLPAAVFITMHIPARSLGILATVASAAGKLPVHSAEHGMPIMPGNIYLAVPDHHLILVDGHMRLGRGPRENLVRPAIDPLFRSAAAAYGPRVIGVVLSGLLNDGASGLEAIKRCGGLAVVQDPLDAIADEMPLAALRAAKVDLTLPGARLGDVLSDLVREPAGWPVPVPPDIRLEVDIAAGERVDSQVIGQVAVPAALTCPHCLGVMSQMRQPRPLRFRCQVGHAMTAEAMAQEQEGTVDEAMRVALRVIEERAELVSKMAEDSREADRGTIAETYAERAAEYRRQADILRRAVIHSMYPPYPPDDEGGQDGGS
ncbi:chemotaxis protein CheB [Roseomonas elaeocarpi]|uniref:protein-glutamate methylesterase n=1 Tax=Roseomonas elaeocarpi TaxID=907779 RepID=A0ABV6JPR4_9PROT